jgi:hypothetical protein
MASLMSSLTFACLGYTYKRYKKKAARCIERFCRSPLLGPIGWDIRQNLWAQRLFFQRINRGGDEIQ